MNTLIPLEYYTLFYYNALLLFVVFVYIQSNQSLLTDSVNLISKNYLGVFILIFTILYMGTRPVSFIFGDMGVYAIDFDAYKNGKSLSLEKDVLFEIFIKQSSNYFSKEFFFLLCSFIYIIPLYFFSKKKFNDYWFYSFLILVVSFSFWAYGTNGIRNGIATSLFLFSISRNNKIAMGVWMIIAVLIHHSLIVPTIAFGIAYFYKNPKPYFLIWLIAIPLSLVLGSFWENFFLNLGVIEEQRIIAYLSVNSQYLDEIVEIKKGFRWDFILYSSIGVVAGWYYIYKKEIKDLFYNQLLSTFLIVNSLWILVIRSNFSNRIAYLSWFMLGIVIIYPLLKNQMFSNQHKIIGSIILLYFLFTYILNVIITG